MPYADPEKKRAANRRWFEARGGYAAEARERRAAMTDEQRKDVRQRDRDRKRAKRSALQKAASALPDGGETE